MKFDLIVIGAGSAGLAFVALLQKRRPDLRIALLESHRIPGGCSSYFERQGYVYDAGATTLSGLAPNHPLDLLMRELKLDLVVEKVDPGMISMIGGKSIERHAQRSLWLEELKKHFPLIDHQKIWNQFFKAHDLGWSLHSHYSSVPIRGLRQIPALLAQSTSFNPIKSLAALRNLTKSAKTALKSTYVDDPHYFQLLNEMLFITAQNQLEDTPLLLASMGLCYPEDTHAPRGGMKAFSHSLLRACREVYFNHRVEIIEQIADQFLITTAKSQFECQTIVSTLPYQNHYHLFKGAFPILQNDQIEDCWSAFTLYLTIPNDHRRKSLYYQIHTKSPIPHCGTHSFFVSLSIPNDALRSPTDSNRQCVTISTHTKSAQWNGLTRENYLKKKNETAEFILKELADSFHIDPSSIANLLTGSPTTFERYTGRYQGNVGGRPHSLKRGLPEQVLQSPPLKNFYLIGDNQFPGQGIAAVVSGARTLATHLEKIL